MATIDYKEKYEQALERARQFMETPYLENSDDVVGFIFPELKESEESENERIRKELIKGISKTRPNTPFLDTNITREDAIAWLEKQGEQKPADKIELKVFKIGDIITNGILVGKIDEIHEFGYHAYFGDHYADVPDIENWHKWTIQDAKAGDVLACESGWTCIFKTLVNDENFSSYCFMDNTKWFCETGSECHTLKEEFVKAYNGKIYPATKEQRDLLFQKMKEAGYEWDAEKKELKKMKQELAIPESKSQKFMIQWKGNNLKEVIDFTGKDKNFEKWFKSFEEYEKYVNDHNGIFKLFNTDGSHYEIPVGAWIVKTPDGYNVASKAIFIQKPAENKGMNLVEEKMTPFQKKVFCIIDTTIEEEQGLKQVCDELLRLAHDESMQKPAWSEEDENRVNRLIAYFEDKESFTAEDDIVYANWLKSLKDRYTWKPSYEQIKAIRLARAFVTDDFDEHPALSEILIELEKQLKRLREE